MWNLVFAISWLNIIETYKTFKSNKLWIPAYFFLFSLKIKYVTSHAFLRKFLKNQILGAEGFNVSACLVTPRGSKSGNSSQYFHPWVGFPNNELCVFVPFLYSTTQDPGFRKKCLLWSFQKPVTNYYKGTYTGCPIPIMTRFW